MKDGQWIENQDRSRRGLLLLWFALILFAVTVPIEYAAYIFGHPIPPVPSPEQVFGQALWQRACPSGQASMPALQTLNPSSGSYIANACVDQFGNVTMQGASHTTNFLDVTAVPYTVKPDARSFTCDTSSGGHLVKSAALFLPSDVGKSIFAYVNGGTADAFPYTTVSGYTDASDITIVASIVTAAAGRTCFIGTDNTAALNIASAALVAGQSLYLPAGNYMISGNVLSNGILANASCPNPNYEVAGEGMGVTNFIVPWFDIAGLGATQPLIGTFSGASCGFWHDFSLDNGIQAQVSSSWNVVFSVPAAREERIRVSNWDVISGGGSGYCLGNPADGGQFQNMETFGCQNGIDALWKDLTYIHPRVSAAAIGMNLGDINGVVIGGELKGGTCGIQNQFQAGVSAWTLIGLNAIGTGPTSYGFCSNGATRTYIVGGSYSGSAGQSSGGIEVAASGYVNAHDANIASFSTGNGISISATGVFFDGGGNVFSSTGSANIFNAGTFVSRTDQASLPQSAPLSSATSIGATIICVSSVCPAGTYLVHIYLSVSTACTTTGSYIPWVSYTDDAGAKSQQPITIDGTGVTFATGSLALNSTSNYGEGTSIIHSNGSNISWGSTAGACGSGGPAAGQIYITIEKIG